MDLSRICATGLGIPRPWVTHVALMRRTQSDTIGYECTPLSICVTIDLEADQTIFSKTFLMKMYIFFVKISLQFVPSIINNVPALAQIMAWRRPGAGPLSKPWMISLVAHIYVSRPYWVNTFKIYHLWRVKNIAIYKCIVVVTMCTTMCIVFWL